MNTPRHETALEESEFDEMEIPYGAQANALVELTPNSAVASVLVNSFAGSGLTVYPDFGTAVRDAWAMGLEDAFGGVSTKEGQTTLPPELREGRRAFHALLDRYEHEGYKPDMAEVLDNLSSRYGHGYYVGITAVLPDDLDSVLDMCYPDEDDEVLEEAPPRADFDLDNDDHLAWLQQRLEILAEF